MNHGLGLRNYPSGTRNQDMKMASQRREPHSLMGNRRYPNGPRDDRRTPCENDQFQWPSDEEMVRLYGESAEEDRALAESGLEEYARVLADMDRDD
jgi:hypothetical protein